MEELAATPFERVSLWRALRNDPMHAPELGVLYTLPQLTPHVEKWSSKKSRARTADSEDRIARQVLRRSTHVARRGGLITGSSFYVGMLPAMAMIYCEQLVVVLRIGAVYGRDPKDPARAAEILVIQGRYSSVQDAAAVLRTVGTPRNSRPEETEVATAVNVVRQLPTMIGLRLRKFARSPIDLLVSGAEVASYLVPVVSLPVWALASARATRRLGHAAIDFYNQPADQLRVASRIVLPPRPRPRTRKLMIASIVPLAVALGVLFSFLPIAQFHHAVRWVGLALGETALLLTFARIIRVTRAPTHPPA